MKSKISAGILLYRRNHRGLEFFLVHPGGPHNRKKDEGAWSVPKGEDDSVRSAQYTVRGSQHAMHSDVKLSSDEEQHLLNIAKREFKEETSFDVDACARGEYQLLQPVKLKSGKTVYAFAVEGDIDADKIVSNTFLFEWPPRSGKQIEIPEVDKGEWFDAETAKKKINERQVAFIVEVMERA